MNTIEYAKNLLIEGKLVAIPTETVYGLGADANNPVAVQKIFTAKGRPATNPLIIHIPHVDAIYDWAIEIPDSAWILAKAFWPGPLTLILKKHPKVLSLVTGGQDSVALRIPNHPLTLELLAVFNSGIAAPSANRSGKVSPTTPAHVLSELGANVDYILDGGPCGVGIESTIISLLGSSPVILRKGSILPSALQNCLEQPILINHTNTMSTPGSFLSHYAPSQPLSLLKKDLLLQKIKTLLEANIPFCVMSFRDNPNPLKIPAAHWLLTSKDPKIYAKELYAHLHTLDTQKTHEILVEEPPETEPWLAIRDRLQRAAHSLK